VASDNNNDPAVEAFDRWDEIENQRGSCDTEAWLERSLAAERAVVAAVAAGPLGLAAKLRLVRAAEGSRHADELVAQVIAALEAMEDLIQV
jgi:hypothetical protein